MHFKMNLIIEGKGNAVSQIAEWHQRCVSAVHDVTWALPACGLILSAVLPSLHMTIASPLLKGWAFVLRIVKEVGVVGAITANSRSTKSGSHHWPPELDSNWLASVPTNSIVANQLESLLFSSFLCSCFMEVGPHIPILINEKGPPDAWGWNCSEVACWMIQSKGILY